MKKSKAKEMLAAIEQLKHHADFDGIPLVDSDKLYDSLSELEELVCNSTGDDVFTGDPDMDSLLKKCLETQKKKGADYTVGSEDKLFNFREIGKVLGIQMELVWAVYFWKHITAVLKYCKAGQTESEPIEERIVDCIVYLLLLKKMISEREVSFSGINEVKEQK